VHNTVIDAVHEHGYGMYLGALFCIPSFLENCHGPTSVLPPSFACSIVFMPLVVILQSYVTLKLPLIRER